MCVPSGSYTITESNFMAVGGSNFTIENEDGEVIIESDSKLFTLHSRIVGSFVETGDLPVETGDEAFTLSRILLSMRTAWCIEAGGQTIATLQKSMLSLHNTVCVYSGDDTSGDPLYTVKNEMCSTRNLTFCDNDDNPVATSHEQHCNLSFCGGDKYDVEVDDGADALIVFATIIAYDEMNEDDKKN